MKKTHLVLHPGEEIRSPRIVLLNWKGGDWQASQNLWRRLILAHYSVQSHGQPVVGPLCYCSWGTESIDKKLAQLKMVQREKLPFDIYWIDAGWYGHSDGEGDAGPSPWWRNRGSWSVNPVPFPSGLKPMAEAVRAAKLGFLLWMEPEEGDPDTTLRIEHPDWFFLPPNLNNPGTALLRLGNPEIRRSITALVSKMILETGMAWYRQDFNANPDRSWAGDDLPDRVGMAEILYIEGLYAFWDELRLTHPGLIIDNCASGGRRIDIETLSRSFPLTRSDLAGTASDAVGSQLHNQALAPWVPLNAGAPWLWIGIDPPAFDAGLIYTLRSGYSTAYGLGLGPAEGKTSAWCAALKATLEEYKEVQPFMYGDFYPLIPYSPDKDRMAACQWDRSDRNAGVLMVFRRPECPYSTVELPLRALDPKARYDVEIRIGLERGSVRQMSGEELTHCPIVIPNKPGSAMLFYTRKS
jgi:alpha-galactosidase